MALVEIASLDATFRQALMPASGEVQAYNRLYAVLPPAKTAENESRNQQAISTPHVRVAKQAQQYILTHYMDAVHLQDLCRVTGVGVRTLQRCFRDYFHLTVSNYLKKVRLEAARRELVASCPEETSVTRIAMQNGCTHLGRFSVEFRERYGVSPRQLLASSSANT